MDILQPAPGAARMGHLLRAVKITGFVIKWGAHLSTLAAGVWMLHGMVVIKLQANKELLENHLVKREEREEKRRERSMKTMLGSWIYIRFVEAGHPRQSHPG
jgi:hypothetical protein